jgi:hypothetical protein
MVGGEVGPTYKVIISRTWYVERQTGKTCIVACGVSLANAEDLGKWMGASEHTIFNFVPRSFTRTCIIAHCVVSACPLDMAIHIQSFSIPHFPSLMIAMGKPAYLAMREYSPSKPVVIFVPSRRQCRLTSDGHGNLNPCGIVGTGVTGMGTGEKKVTCDVPVPVLAGDGSVTRLSVHDILNSPPPSTILHTTSQATPH